MASSPRPTSSTTSLWWLFVVALAPTLLSSVLLPGCSGPARIGARGDAPSGVRAYIIALRANNPRNAYDMLATKTRQQLSYQEFKEAWREHQRERLDQANALEEGLRGVPQLSEHATLRFSTGKTVGLVRERGQWRFDSGLVSQRTASQPIDAIRILAAALSGRQYDELMSILTARRRNGIAHQIDALSTSLLENLDGEIALIGPSRAELTWDTESLRYKIVLRKEAGEWRIDDLHIRPKSNE